MRVGERGGSGEDVLGQDLAGLVPLLGHRAVCRLLERVEALHRCLQRAEVFPGQVIVAGVVVETVGSRPSKSAPLTSTERIVAVISYRPCHPARLEEAMTQTTSSEPTSSRYLPCRRRVRTRQG